MEKVKQIILSFVHWIFVGFCLILAIGMPWGAGTVLMLLAAVMAAPVKKIRKVWDVILDLLPQEKKARRQSKKRQESSGKTNAKKMKALIIALVFIFGFTFGMAETESATPSDPALVISEWPTGTATETSAEVPIDMSSVQTTEKATQPPAEIPTESPTETPTTPHTEPPAETPTEPTVPTSPENSTFSIHFIDVGQADAAVVECDGHYMLIDGGNKADSSKIYTVLKNAGAPKLDIVVGTHAHEDHIGGIPGAFNFTTADLTLCPVTSYDSEAFKDFKKYAGKHGGGITVPKAGDTYALGSATVEILGVNGGSDANNSSIILRICYGETTFLFAGDAEREAEQAVLATVADLSATVLKVGHHGSDTSTTYPFLRAVMPRYAVISVGEGNVYSHPTENTLSRFSDADVTVFRTDMQGDIYCVSDGHTVTMTVTKNKDADVLSGPMENERPTEKPTEMPKAADNDAVEGRNYVANKNTKKFHYPSCSSVKQMKEKNRWDFFGTRQELINKGYQPCKNCNP